MEDSPPPRPLPRRGPARAPRSSGEGAELADGTALGAGDPGGPRLRSPPAGHPHRGHGRRARPRGQRQPRAGRLQRRRRRGARPVGGRLAAGQDARAHPAAVGRRSSPSRNCAASACACRSSSSASCATAVDLDNRRLKAAGYRYRYTTREALIAAAGRSTRLAPLLGSGRSPTATSPTWRSSCAGARASGGPGARQGGRRRPARLRRLAAGELDRLIASLEVDALHALRRYEAEHQRRAGRARGLERTLARLGA